LLNIDKVLKKKHYFISKSMKSTSSSASLHKKLKSPVFKNFQALCKQGSLLTASYGILQIRVSCLSYCRKVYKRPTIRKTKKRMKVKIN